MFEGMGGGGGGGSDKTQAASSTSNAAINFGGQGEAGGMSPIVAVVLAALAIFGFLILVLIARK